MKKSKGFTLIELLVVIAIIGILAGIVLVNVNKARNKGSDAAIEAGLSQIRSAAEIYYNGDGNNKYTNLFTNDSDTKRIIDNVNRNNGSANNATTSASADAYCASSVLKSNPSKTFCVDSVGDATSGADCSTSNHVCQ